MHFEPNVIYHIYNQGNNRQPIFFKDENYLFFLDKIRRHISPHVHFLAYCLMPNHFHWLVLAKEEACNWMPFANNSNMQPRQKLNHEINILLRSYARAINKQENRSGSLFRQHTKAKNGWEDEFLGPVRRKNTTDGFALGIEPEYALNCFNYIHDNPIEAKLVSHPTDWAYSSARDFAGLRKGTLCNQDLARKILGL